MSLIAKPEKTSQNFALAGGSDADSHDSRVSLLRGAGLGVLALLLCGIAILYFLDWNMMRGPIGRYASARAGREVRIDGDLQVHLFRLQPRVEAGGLYIGNPFWVAGRPEGASVKKAVIEFRLLPAIFGRWRLPLVELDQARALVVRADDGRTNWGAGGNPKGAGAAWHLPPINRFLVRDGHLEIDDAVRKLKFTGTISSQEQAGAGQGAFQLSGDGTLNGNMFNADVHGGPLLNVDESKPYDFVADVTAGSTKASLQGSILHPFQFDRFDATVSFSGNNLSDLYDLTGLALPRTPPYRISAHLMRQENLYRLVNLAGQLGSSDLHGDLSVDVSGERPALRGSLTSRMLDFADLGAVIGGGQYAPPAERTRLFPDTVLHTERLRQMDADVVYAADSIRSRDFPLKGLATHILLKDGVLNLNPISFGFSQGKLSGTLKIDARHDVPVTSVDARITDIHVENLIKGAEKPVSGMVEARAMLTGRGNSVHKAASTADGTVTAVIPSGRIRHSLAEWLGINALNALSLTLSGDESDTGVRCGVAHFGAKNGMLTSEQFVLDTDPVLVDGNGSINLSDETLDMRIQGKPKHFQFFRLRAPISASGSLAHPDLGVDAKPLAAQGALGAGLGVINPLAAIFAFIDPGLAKNADCAGLISTARQEGAPVKIKS